MQSGGDIGPRRIEGITSQAQQAPWRHDLSAEDGNGGHALANGVEKDEAQEVPPRELREHVALEAGAGDADVVVGDAGDAVVVSLLDGLGEGLVGCGGHGGGCVGQVLVGRVGGAFLGGFGVLRLGTQVDDGLEMVVSVQTGAVGGRGLVGAGGAVQEAWAEQRMALGGAVAAGLG